MTAFRASPLHWVSHLLAPLHYFSESLSSSEAVIQHKHISSASSIFRGSLMLDFWESSQCILTCQLTSWETSKIFRHIWKPEWRYDWVIRNKRLAINQTVVWTSRNQTRACHNISYSNIWSVNDVFVGYAFSQPNVWESWTFDNVKMNK